MAYNLEPVYSIAIAAILFNELQEVGLSFWVGIFLIVLSVVLQTYSIVAKNNSVSGLFGFGQIQPNLVKTDQLVIAPNPLGGESKEDDLGGIFSRVFHRFFNPSFNPF